MIKLTVMDCKSALVLRSISAFGTPQKVFLIRLRVAVPMGGFVLTILNLITILSLSEFINKTHKNHTNDYVVTLSYIRFFHDTHYVHLKESLLHQIVIVSLMNDTLSIFLDDLSRTVSTTITNNRSREEESRATRQ